MRHRIICIALPLLFLASGASAQLPSGSASRANGGGTGPVDPTPGSESPTPTIVGPGARQAPVPDAARRPSVQETPETRCVERKGYPRSRFGAGGDYRCGAARRRIHVSGSSSTPPPAPGRSRR